MNGNYFAPYKKIGYHDHGTVSKGKAVLEDFVDISRRIVQPAVVKLSDEQKQEFFVGSEWLSAIINRIVADATKARPVVMSKDPSAKVYPEQRKRINRINDFLDDPNGWEQSFTELRKAFLTDKLVFGHCAYERVSDNGRLKELYSLPAKNLKLHTDERGNLGSPAYSQETTRLGKPVEFEKDEVIHSVFRPYSGSRYGISPLDNLANSVASDILLAAYNSNFFINNGEAAGVLSLTGMSPKELKKFRTYWRENFKGVDKSHGISVVNVPVDWIRMAVSNRDMQFHEYGLVLLMKMMSVYFMQPAVMGISLPGHTGATSENTQMQIYKDAAIIPLLNDEAELYTRYIIKQGFGFDDLMFGFTHVDRMDSKIQAETDDIYLKNGTRVVNDICRQQGWPEKEWGDYPFSIQPGGSQIAPGGALTPPSQQPVGNKKPVPKKSIQSELCELSTLISVKLGVSS